MSLKYESPEFVEELKKRINSSQEYREKAKGVNWKILIIVKEIPFATLSTYADGELVERKHIRASEIEEYRKKSDFTVEVPSYDLSIEMATGKKSMESLFMSRMIKVEGSIFKALQYRGALELSTKITAELANASSIPSKEEFTAMLKERGLL
jgi:predicted lipid carrier protein YhbT